MSALSKLLSKLDKVERHGHYCLARCPAHDDRKASLSISEKEGNVLLKCHAGCSTKSILNALQMTFHDLFEANNGNSGRRKIEKIYDYIDEEGRLVHQTVRYFPKDFKQRRPDGQGGWIWKMGDTRLVLYNLPDVLRAQQVFVVEGEKDADNLMRVGLTATTSPMGAEKWRSHYGDFLSDKNIVIIPDNDEAGEKHVMKIVANILGKARSVKVVRLDGLEPKGDVSDWLNSGGTKEALLELVEKTEGEKGEKGEERGRKGKEGEERGIEGKEGESRGNSPKKTWDDNLRGLVRSWVEESPGIFTTSQIDRELGLSSAQAKKKRSDYLAQLVCDGLIERDLNRRGVFRKKDNALVEMDILGASSAEIPIDLPFGLSKYIEINNKEIILLMGETNAGKTTVIFNMIWSCIRTLRGEGILREKNDRAKDGYYGIRYFSSEMGATGVRKKLQAFGPDYPLPEWVKFVSSVERNRDFQDVIDPCGFNFIDYLEVFDGEYFKLSSALTAIHAALETGIAVIALQKKRGTDVGRGGEATLEKPRLALALFEDMDKGYSTVKIVKAKHYRDKNPVGYELDFLIGRRGTGIKPISEWGYAEAHQIRRSTYSRADYDRWRESI